LYWKSGNDNMPEREGILKRSREVDSEEREKLARETAERLGIDLNEINRKRMFHFMTPDELRTLEQAGMGIELHTHRHRFPYDQAAVTAEVVDNRASLERILPGRYTHLCYPSGRFRDEQFPWLAPLGVRSATTTEKGFNTPRTPIFRLNRLLDREKMTDLEFEAEICGVMELFRSPVR
jgi:peptidoglycan/xylan/chitin deacetylase (PgdA/CDA1 family)